MLGKVVVVAGAGATYLLRTRAGQQQVARVLDRVRSLQAGAGTPSPVADRRPQAALEHRPAPPVLLPDDMVVPVPVPLSLPPIGWAFCCSLCGCCCCCWPNCCCCCCPCGCWFCLSVSWSRP